MEWKNHKSPVLQISKNAKPPTDSYVRKAHLSAGDRFALHGRTDRGTRDHLAAYRPKKARDDDQRACENKDKREKDAQ